MVEKRPLLAPQKALIRTFVEKETKKESFSYVQFHFLKVRFD